MLVDDGDFPAVYLLGGDKGACETKLSAQRAVCLIKPAERLSAIGRNIDLRDARDKSVPDEGEITQRRKKLQRRVWRSRVNGHDAGYFPDGWTRCGAVVVVLVIRVSRRLRVSGSSNSAW